MKRKKNAEFLRKPWVPQPSRGPAALVFCLRTGNLQTSISAPKLKFIIVKFPHKNQKIVYHSVILVIVHPGPQLLKI